MICERALLLSAGRGERLRPLTDDRPKTMMPIGGRPLLEYHVVLLRESGVRDIVINLHHRGDAVRNHFGNGDRWRVSIHYSEEPELLGTAGAARRAAAFLDGEPFLVVYGDNLFDFDLAPLLRFHAGSRGVATLALCEGPDPTAGGIVEIDANSVVTRFAEKPRCDQVFSHLVNAGIYVLEPEVLAFIPAGRPSDFGRDVLPVLAAAGRPVHALRLDGYLCGIDTPDLLQQARMDVAAGRVAHPLLAES